jgi:hypothetical protein
MFRAEISVVGMEFPEPLFKDTSLSGRISVKLQDFPQGMIVALGIMSF